jgi:hypothetical protein
MCARHSQRCASVRFHGSNIVRVPFASGRAQRVAASHPILLPRFRANEVIKAVKALLDERLKGKKYDSNESAQLSKELCTEIKEKVKEIGAPRHKLVVQVTIGEVQGQGVRIASRCLWDVETDNHASAYYTNPYLYCVAMVFACYYE